MQLVRIANLATDTTLQRTLPPPASRYVGFAIGPDSEHDRLRVRTSKGVFSLCVGGALALDLAPGERPVLEASRLGGVTVADVLAAERDCELAGLPRRRAGYQSTQSTATSAASYATLVTIPFAGRRRGSIYLRNTGSGGSLHYKLLGRTWYGTGASDYEEAVVIAETSLQQETTVALVVGGYDEAEDYDALVLQTKSNSADTPHRALARAWGELSD